MTLRTVSRELGRLVVGVVRAIVIRHMAGITIGGRALVAIGVALQAIDPGMTAGEREPGRIMVIRGRDPGCFPMAYRAIRGELGRRVVRVGGAVVIGQVAACAGVRCVVVVAVVALVAVHGGV